MLLLSDLKIDAKKFESKKDSELVDLISAKLRAAGGNLLMNPTRNAHDLSYKQILIDVADKLAPGRVKWSHFRASGPEAEVEVEDYIAARLEAKVAEMLAKMNDADKRRLQERLEADMRTKGVPESVVRGTLTGISAGALSGVALGPLIASLLFGGIWASLFGLTMAELLIGGTVVGGPIGIALATVAVVSGPSYSKTIPAVYRLILIRRSADARDALRAKA